MDIREWLTTCGFEAFADSFLENGVDESMLAELTNDDLKDLGVARLIDRKKLLAAIGAIGDISGPSPTPQPDTPPSQAPTKAQGERRQVTILFSDLAGFTNLSTQLDAEVLHTLINKYYHMADACIERYGGTVDKHIGDGIMALFGAPQAHGDDPLRAIRAAFDIHAGMIELSQELDRELSVHIGIAAGEVIAGGLGSEDNSSYTVIGDSVNLASRLEGVAKTGETVIDETVYQATLNTIDTQSLKPVMVKGLNDPVSVWKATQFTDTNIQYNSTPFVGRRSELRQFESLLSVSSEESTGQTILLRGEAGIGKSRLLNEFTVISKSLGFGIHKGLVLDFGVGKGQDATAQLLRSLLAIPHRNEEACCQAVEEAVAAEWLPSEQQVYLRDILNLPQLTEHCHILQAMDNTSRNQAQQQMISDLVLALSRQGPLVLIVEDIHWSDPTTLTTLSTLTQAVRNCPAIFVMTTRMDGDPLDNAWRSTTHNSPLMTMDIGPLRESESIALATGLLTDKDSAVLQYVKRSDGNPLFLEQLLRGANDKDTDNLPPSLQSLVLARVDRLKPNDKEALQAAAVIGKRFSLEAVRHIIGNASYAFAPLLNEQLIRPEGDEFLFSHALIQEGVYSSLLHKTRRQLHLKAADLFNHNDPILYAEHLDRADDEGAPRAYLEAASIQIEKYRDEQALRLLMRGLEIATNRDEIFKLTCRMGKAQHDLGAIDCSIQSYTQALELASGDLDLCHAHLGLAAGLRVADRYDDALSHLDKAQVFASKLDLVHERAEIHHLRGNLYFPMGRLEECAAEHEASLTFAKKADSPKTEANALSGMADAHYMAGRMATANKYFSQCVDIANQNGLSRIAVVNLSMAGFSEFYLNVLDMDKAFSVIETAKKVGHQRAEVLGQALASYILLEREEFDQARYHNALEVECAQKLGSPRFEAQALLYCGKIELATGHPQKAITVLRAALAASESVGHGFAGPRICSALALSLEDPVEKCEALAEGERQLKAGAVSHNHLFFYPNAMDVCLSLNDWEGVEHHIQALTAFTKGEPLPWSNFFINRAKALSAHGQGMDGDALATNIQSLIDEAHHAQIFSAIPALKNAQ